MNVIEMVKVLSREQKINFLMKSKVFDSSTLENMDDNRLNDLTVVGLNSTGFR